MREKGRISTLTTSKIQRAGEIITGDPEGTIEPANFFKLLTILERRKANQTIREITDTTLAILE